MKKLKFLLVLSVLLVALAGCTPKTTTTDSGSTDAANAAEVLYSDDFSDPNSGWEVGDYDGGSVGYGNGFYFARSSINSIMWGVGPQTFDDTVIDVDATQVEAPANDNNAYGLYCRRQGEIDATDAYVFLISGDGYYSVQIEADGEFTPLIDWTQSDAINQGNATNHLTVTCAGDNLSMTVNGTLLVNTTDSTYTSGALALAAITLEDGSTTEVHFTNLVVTKP